jgi:hypothetical protein
MVMGIASTLALILIVIKALGLTTLSWGWCLAGFGVDIFLFLACITGGFFFARSASKKIDKEFFGGDFEERFNKAKDRLG